MKEPIFRISFLLLVHLFFFFLFSSLIFYSNHSNSAIFPGFFILCSIPRGFLYVEPCIAEAVRREYLMEIHWIVYQKVLEQWFLISEG